MKALLGMFVVMLFAGLATCRADSTLSANVRADRTNSNFMDLQDAAGNTFQFYPGNHGAAIPPWPQDFATGPAAATATAEPATGLLVGLGLAVASLIRRRRKKLVDPTVWENLG